MTKPGEEKLTFGELAVGEHFIGFPMPGDNSGHGGYLNGAILFKKTQMKATGKFAPIESGTAVNNRGIDSHFPDMMPIYKVIAEDKKRDAEFSALKLQVEDLKKLIREALPFMRARHEWKKTAPHADMILAMEKAITKHQGLLCRDCSTPVHYPYDCPDVPEYQKVFANRKTICIHCDIEVPGNVPCPKCGR